jgi:hypothetical protein
MSLTAEDINFSEQPFYTFQTELYSIYVERSEYESEFKGYRRWFTVELSYYDSFNKYCSIEESFDQFEDMLKYVNKYYNEQPKGHLTAIKE